MDTTDVLRLLGPGASDPLGAVWRWVEDAGRAGHDPPNAMALATVEAGTPSVRMVLLKGVDRGLVFYTNLDSRKGHALEAHPRAGVCLHFERLGRQIRAEGPIEPVTEAEADEYFASRPRDRQLGAWASDQSAPLDRRETLLERYRALEARHLGLPIPRPPRWGGFRLVPDRLEFWLADPSRLHDRVEFVFDPQGVRCHRLYP